MNKAVEVSAVNIHKDSLRQKARELKYSVLTSHIMGIFLAVAPIVCLNDSEVAGAMTSRGLAGCAVGFSTVLGVWSIGAYSLLSGYETYNEYANIRNDIKNMPDEVLATTLDPQDYFHGEGFIVQPQED